MEEQENNFIILTTSRKRICIKLKKIHHFEERELKDTGKTNVHISDEGDYIVVKETFDEVVYKIKMIIGASRIN